jgi:serine/threonine protein kinase
VPNDHAYDRLKSFISNPPSKGPPESEIPHPAAGLTIGRYEVLRQRAKGGAASVFEAFDPQLRRRVALKVLTAGAAHPHMVARMHREAAITAQLQHPGIVSVHEAGTVTGPNGVSVHYIAMDYIEGRSLAEILRHRTADLVTLLQVLEDVANAAAFAHVRGVVHRDIKPGNILVEDTGRVLLTDFGLARSESSDGSITGFHTILGTPQYMAPEQILGHVRQIGPSTDVWALGVVLYEILTGRLPFEGKTIPDLQGKIVQDAPVPPSQIDPAVDRELELVCLRALSKSVHDRYSTALEFAEDLMRWRMGEVLSTQDPTRWERFRRFAQRQSALLFVAITAGIAGVLLGSGVVLLTASVRRPLAVLGALLAMLVPLVAAAVSLRLALRPSAAAREARNRPSQAPASRRRESGPPTTRSHAVVARPKSEPPHA